MVVFTLAAREQLLLFPCAPVNLVIAAQSPQLGWYRSVLFKILLESLHCDSALT